nr:hypothetical protein [Paracoccus liaowanqingii]
MIGFRTLPDDHPDLAHSPLLRATLLTLRYAQDHRSIGSTKMKAFRRVFVQWAVENFDWPGKGAEEMFRYSKVINEYELLPLEVLRYLLITLHLGRHLKGELGLTKRGGALAQEPARLFAELIPFFVLKIDHSSYARFKERPFGKWDVWMNVINVEADHGVSELELFAAFYGKEDARWREVNLLSSSVLRMLRCRFRTAAIRSCRSIFDGPDGGIADD